MPADQLPRHPSDALMRLVRLFRIIDLVRSHRAGLPLGRRELAEACDCDVRTIQRDITLLQDEAGVPLEYAPKLHAYTLPSKGWTYPIIQIAGDEALALALAGEMLGAPGIPCGPQIAATLSKLTASLPQPLLDISREAAMTVQIGSSPRDYSTAPVQALMAAAAARETLEMDYFSRSKAERSCRRVDVYAVEAREGQYWELHAWCHTRQALRTFAIDQIGGIRRTGETFIRRDGEWAEFADTTGIMGGLRSGPMVAVEVRFDPAVALYALGRRWPDGLSIQKSADGCAVLSGTVMGYDGIIPELLRWRRHAQVLGGAPLKARLMDELRAMAALYADDAPKKDA